MRRATVFLLGFWLALGQPLLVFGGHCVSSFRGQTYAPARPVANVQRAQQQRNNNNNVVINIDRNDVFAVGYGYYPLYGPDAGTQAREYDLLGELLRTQRDILQLRLELQKGGGNLAPAARMPLAGGGLPLTVQHCGRCHDASVADSKGRGLALTKGNEVAYVADPQSRQTLAEALHSGRMPRGARLTPLEQYMVFCELTTQKGESK